MNKPPVNPDIQDGIRRGPLPTKPVRYQFGTAKNIGDRLLVEAEGKRIAETLKAHMLQISGDPRGSIPDEYLSQKDLEMISKFMRLAKHIGWAGSREIGLQTSRIPGKLVWNGKNTQPAKNTLVRAVTMQPVGETHRGYIFGSLAIGQPSPSVVIADNGLLYSERSIHMLTPSYGDGWGRLPDIDILNPAIGVGNMNAVKTGSYQKKLFDVLMAGIPDEALLGTDLRDFGLAA